MLLSKEALKVAPKTKIKELKTELKVENKTWWGSIKSWFSNSETIFLNRIEVVAGIIVAGVATMDWSPLLSLGVDTQFNWQQLYFISGLSIVRGIVGEIARRRNTVDL